MEHFIDKYSKQMNRLLHVAMEPSWYYKHEVYEIKDLFTALIITFENQKEDEFHLYQNISYATFLSRMSEIRPDWQHFKKSNFEDFATKPDKTMLGSEKKTFYFIRGGNNPEFWTESRAFEDIYIMLKGKQLVQPEMMKAEFEFYKNVLPTGKEHFQDYEKLVQKTIDYLFLGNLGYSTLQVRNEPGDEGLEIRDLICQNRAESGFWFDLKNKYSCFEIIFDAKNTKSLTRDNLRQVYCYLKPAIGFWGFIVCRSEQPKKIHQYNRTLFKNFNQERGVLIISDDDLKDMITWKENGHSPEKYLRDMMSKFIRSI